MRQLRGAVGQAARAGEEVADRFDQHWVSHVELSLPGRGGAAGEPPWDVSLQAETFHLALIPPKSGKGVCGIRSQHLYRGFLFFSLRV